MGKVIGYTQGTYDMFHIGHLNLIKNAKRRCDYLIVGVNTDELVESYKNKRPIVPLEERAEIVRSIKYVDEVIITNTLDKKEIWDKIRFDEIYIGDDWKINQPGSQGFHLFPGALPALISLPVISDINFIETDFIPDFFFIKGICDDHLVHIFNRPDDLCPLFQRHDRSFILIAFHKLICIYAYDQIITSSLGIFDQVQMTDMKHIVSSLCVSDYLSHIAVGEDPFKEERRRLLPAMHTMPKKSGYCEALAEYLNIK